MAAKGLKIEPEPWKDVADALGLTQEEVIEGIGRLIEEGKVRRFAASVRHQPIGYSHNTMVVVRTSEDDLDQVGNTGAGIDAVSHCYHRAHPNGDPWCVYMMVHGTDLHEVNKAIEQIKQIPGVRGIEVCASIGELKKTSLTGVSTDLV